MTTSYNENGRIFQVGDYVQWNYVQYPGNDVVKKTFLEGKNYRISKIVGSMFALESTEIPKQANNVLWIFTDQFVHIPQAAANDCGPKKKVDIMAITRDMCSN